MNIITNLPKGSDDPSKVLEALVAQIKLR